MSQGLEIKGTTKAICLSNATGNNSLISDELCNNHCTLAYLSHFVIIVSLCNNTCRDHC